MIGDFTKGVEFAFVAAMICLSAFTVVKISDYLEMRFNRFVSLIFFLLLGGIGNVFIQYVIRIL